MNHRRLLGLSALTLLVAALPLTLACTTGGDRTRLGCPAGEQCSSRVDGLYFAGTVPEAHSLFALALGASERVRVQIEPGLSHAIYTGPFDARSSDLSVLGIGLASGAEVTVLGQSAGHAYLRIVEPGTDILLDRVDVRVAAVAAVHVTTVLAAFSSAADDEITAVWTSARAQLVVTLVDASGGVLWDDSLEVAGHPSTLVQVPVGLELTAVAPASGTLALMLVRDAATHPVSLPVVSSATGIALFPDDATIELTLGTTTFFCALGRTATGLIAGAPVAATHPAGVSDAPDAIPQIDGVPVDGCVGIRGDALGLARVTISIGAQATDVAVTVVPGAVPLEGPAIDLGHLHGWTSAGERLRD